MKSDNLTPERSIDLILETINATRAYTERRAHRPFLIWGYATIITSLAVWYGVRTTHNPNLFWLWWALPVIGWLGMWLFYGKEERTAPRTHIDRVISHLWMTLAVAGAIAALASWLGNVNILFCEAMIMACGTAITGLILRWRVIIIAGFASMLLSLLFVWMEGIDQCLVFAALFLVMMVIPGHIIGHSLKSKRDA